MSDNKSVDKMLKILELISKNPQGLSLAQIYKELNLPKSTVFDFLQALYKADAVYFKDEVEKTYVIGSKMYAIGQAYQRNSSLIKVCKPILRHLNDKYGNLFYVTKRVDDQIVYVYKCEDEALNNATFEIGGSISYIHTNSNAKCWLAFDNNFNAIAKLDLGLVTPYSIVRIEELRNQIEVAKQKGYTYDKKEDNILYQSVSFPIYNFENRCVGVLTYQAPCDDIIDATMIDEFIKQSYIISKKLGFKKMEEF